jgi:glucose-6-phosphate isomerase
VTTDEYSRLWDAATEKGFTTLSIPKKVGGRYSVFSALGLFPLALAGVNIEELVTEAREMRETCLQKNIFENPALLSATLLYEHYQQGIRIQNTFFFNPELEK